MSWFQSQSFGVHTAVAVVAGFVMGISAEVLADTVYTWTTEDGTVAYTDEDKRVPARYRGQAEIQVLEGGLAGYERFTPVESGAHTLGASGLNGGALDAVAPAGAVTAPSGISVMTGGSRYGNGGVLVPVESDASDEPMIVENRRVKPKDSMATRHETVVRQGDRVIMIRRDELNQRDATGMVPPVDD